MKLEKDDIKRCGIFLFFDKDGIVDEYILKMLRDMQENTEHLLVVCNGFVTSEGLKCLKQVSSEVICRANVGFDVGGYREGLFYLGWKFLEKFDELVMMNYTFFGPIYPFSEMFCTMQKKDVSFWGITKHHKVDPDPFHALPYGYLPEHIQSHFLVLRNDLFMSYHYRDFICNMKNPQTYLESICGYEAIFTKYFSDLGFQWEVYVNTDEYEGYSYNPLMFYAKEMLDKKRCPILKRRSFFTDYNDYLLNTCGEASSEMYEYLQEQKLYDLDLIWDNLLRLENLAAIHRVLHLNYVLDSCQTEYDWRKKLALVLFADSGKWIEEYKKYLNPLAEKTDIYVCGTAGVCGAIKKAYGNPKVIWCETEEKSTVKKFQMALLAMNREEYDYVGFAHIQDVERMEPYSNAVSWQYGDFENMFGSLAVVGNILKCLDENPRMGMCIPPTPYYGVWIKEIGNGWGSKFRRVKEALEHCKVSVNIDEKQSPMVPYGGNFWIDGELLCGLSDYLKQIEETDEDVLMILLPLFVQKLGKYTGVVYKDCYVSTVVTNQDYMLRENNKVLFEQYGASFQKVVVDRIYEDNFESGEKYLRGKK